VALRIHCGLRSGIPRCREFDFYRAAVAFVCSEQVSSARSGPPKVARPKCMPSGTGPNQQPSVTLSLILFVGLAPFRWPERFFLWLVISTGSFLLVTMLRGPRSGLRWLLWKLVRLGISVCLLYGFWMLMNWALFWSLVKPLGLTRNRTGFELILAAILLWWVSVFWILFSRRRPHKIAVPSGLPQQVLSPSQSSAPNPALAISQRQPSAKVPQLGFADVGGLEQEKRQIRELVQSRMEPGKYSKYGVVRNGILLYGPPGSGKTFLAEATAGEFGLPFWRVLAGDMVSMWMGETEKRIHAEFADAAAHTPALLFFDEVDSLVTSRQALGGGGDPGGAGRSFNSATTVFMEMMTKYRDVPGLVLMLATNKLGGLDEAVVREGRIDLEISVDLPDQAARLEMLRKQLEKRPWRQFDLMPFARKTAGASPAKIRALVDMAATFAAGGGRKIDEDDLRRAFDEAGGKDRPLVEPVEWSDLVLEEEVERDVRMLIRLLGEPRLAEKMQVPIPTGVLLIGPTGTGKTSIAQLMATQTKRSFYAITPADILGRYMGDSVRQVAELFSRAKGHSPALIFIDEMDALLPQATLSLGQHDVQVVDQFLVEISSLQPENNVFLVGATNRPESIDPRVLRGGRFSEKIKIGLPGREGRGELIRKFLGPTALEPGLDLDFLSKLMDGFAPADLKAVCDAAKRFAFMRAVEGQGPFPLSRADFEGAISRVRGLR
jgi:transitional endoplasmic reticulum ATPase